DPATIDTTEVRPGTKLTLSMKSGGTRTLTLLGPWDSKPEEGIYSYLSDLGKALLGKLTGEEVDVLGEAAVLEKIEPFRPA
ncbi:MAG: GreA/GreB family elongation factor, partial [Acidobacteria bacterium]|nr:GreA/GreB family elongation factor [Acidobacteriota bacterium]